MAAFAVGLFPQALQRADSTHLAWVSCVTFALPARRRRRAVAGPVDPGRRSAASTIAAVARARRAAARPRPLLHLADVRGGDRADVRLPAQPAEHARTRAAPSGTARRTPSTPSTRCSPVVDELADPGDRLFVGSGRPPADALQRGVPLLPPSRPRAGHPLHRDGPRRGQRPDSGLADELRSADVAILSSIRDDWNEPNDSIFDGPNEPNVVLARRLLPRRLVRRGVVRPRPLRGVPTVLRVRTAPIGDGRVPPCARWS